MANKLAGGVKAGTTSYSTDVLLLSSSDGSEMTGRVAANVTAYYWRQGGSPTAITCSDLAAITTAWASGGFKEADATNMKGSYRLDIPDAAFATGADWVEVNVSCAGSQFYKERYALETVGAAEVNTLLGTVNTAVAGLVATMPSAAAIATAVWAAGTRSLTTFSTVVADVATAVWTAAGRTLSSFGFNVTLATSVWDEVSASHLTAGSTGFRLNAAASAGDPWGTNLPGAYAAGTAGNILGNRLDVAVSTVSAGSVPTAAQVAAAVRTIIVETEGNVTLQEAISVLLATTAGVTADAGRTRKTANGAATRAVGTFNAAGERLTSTLTPSS